MTLDRPSRDLLMEQSYLVARAVRPMALIGHCPAEPLTMLRMATRIEREAVPGSIPFVIDRGDGHADYGYAAAGWVIDCYRWLVTAADSQVPQRHLHHMLGLLLGYCVEAIRLHEEQASRHAFPSPLNSGLDGLASNSPPGDRSGRAETSRRGSGQSLRRPRNHSDKSLTVGSSTLSEA